MYLGKYLVTTVVKGKDDARQEAVSLELRA